MAAMKLIFTCLAALCMLQVLNATPMRRSADTHSENTLQTDTDMMETARRTVSDAITRVGTYIGENHNTEEVVAAIKTSSQTLADHMKAIVTQLQTEISAHTSESSNTMVQSALESWNQTVARLTEAHPEVSAQATELKTEIETNMQKVMDGANNLMAVMREHAGTMGVEIQNIAKSALDQTTAVATHLSEQVHAAVQGEHAAPGHHAAHEHHGDH